MSKKEDEAQVIKDEKAATKAAEKEEAHALLHGKYVEQFGDVDVPDTAKGRKALKAALERGQKLAPAELTELA